MRGIVSATVATSAILLAACAVPGLIREDSARPSDSAVRDVPAGTRSASPPLAKGADAWVAVSVATLWRSPAAPRPVDAPALAAPARIPAWLAAMSLDERRALNGRADTQALLGDKVVVLRLRPRWVKVAIPDQPTPAHRRGYPGWVPRRQLTAAPPTSSARRATVTDRLAWLRVDRAGGPQVLRVSFGTRLPVVGTSGSWVRVATPGGVVRRVRASAVSVHAAGAAALAPTRRGVVATARSFVGLDYLWAGRSGFGFDCSGLTSLVYRAHGVRIPRDASPQSQAGTAVTRLRRGDLMFFADSGGVHHVSMYAGGGMMVHSPRTGTTVQMTDVDAQPYASEYSGARRYLG